MSSKTLAFIGAGHMATSLIGGLIQNNYPAAAIWASDPHSEKLQALHDRFGIHTTTDNQQAAQQADILILCLKPQALSPVVQSLATTLVKREALVISIAAGVRLNSLAQWLGQTCAIIRCMPNTPALVSCGATGLVANAIASEADKTLAESIMRTIGLTVWLENEQQLDSVTALSGSGPAYFFAIMNDLKEAAIVQGLPAEAAHLLIIQTCLGAAKMALESPLSLAQLRQQVTSPGGTTEAALGVFEDAKISDILQQALDAAQKRAVELGDDFAQQG